MSSVRGKHSGCAPDNAMLGHILEGVEQAQRLVHTSPDVILIDLHALQLALHASATA